MIFKKIALILFLFFVQLGLAIGQKPKSPSANPPTTLDRPKLVVGIVVDQMRYDFLYRYFEKYGSGGFKRMLREGYSFSNCQYSYFPTKTAAGHASIYSGTTPALHGVVGNDWFEPRLDKEIHCVQDDSVRCLGGNEANGRKSPRNMKTFSVADQIKLATNFRSKCFGLSLKDRGAILPAGHAADGAFWFDPVTGNFISSTYYKNLKGKLPGWLNAFNQKGLAAIYRQQIWNTLLPIEQYVESAGDDSEFEESIIKKQKPIFPYDLAQAEGNGFDIVKGTPFGNTLTAELAKALIEGENMGMRNTTDFLAISFSSTDEVGHDYGPVAVETEDTYLRLDKDLEDLFQFLDSRLGKGNYLTFLTADHGVIEVPAFLQSHQLPAGYFPKKSFLAQLKAFSLQTFDSAQVIRYYINEQIFLDNGIIKARKLDRNEALKKVIEFIEQQHFVFRAFAYSDPRPFPEIPMISKYEAGYFKGRSGDIQIILSPGILERESRKGTSHTAPFSYDSHVPCLWMGWKIAPGENMNAINIQDIAPTLSGLLHIMEPNGTTGKAQFIPLKQ